MTSRYIEQSRKIIFSHPRLQLSEARITLPNGSQTDYLLYDNLPDSVCILALNSNDQVLVNYEYTYPADKYIYGFPAGVCEAGEDASQTAHRELREESGLVAGSLQKLGDVMYNHRRSTARYHFFLATDLTTVPSEKEDVELIESAWIDVSAFQEMVNKGKVDHIGTIAAWGIYINARQKQT